MSSSHPGARVAGTFALAALLLLGLASSTAAATSVKTERAAYAYVDSHCAALGAQGTISQLTRFSYVAGTSSQYPGECLIGGRVTSPGVGVEVQILAGNPALKAGSTEASNEYARSFETIKGDVTKKAFGVGAASYQTVDGLGTKAFTWNPIADAQSVVEVLVGTVYIGVEIQPNSGSGYAATPGDYTAQALALARYYVKTID